MNKNVDDFPEKVILKQLSSNGNSLKFMDIGSTDNPYLYFAYLSEDEGTEGIKKSEEYIKAMVELSNGEYIILNNRDLYKKYEEILVIAFDYTRSKKLFRVFIKNLDNSQLALIFDIPDEVQLLGTSTYRIDVDEHITEKIIAKFLKWPPINHTSASTEASFIIRKLYCILNDLVKNYSSIRRIYLNFYN